ncbi:MAG: hypothetical protein JSV77_01465 [Dehalococcoidales bacterium]|nr:MAG: hypothetical protein JSV77_01465 [Dehalococcoidales bacterium]
MKREMIGIIITVVLLSVMGLALVLPAFAHPGYESRCTNVLHLENKVPSGSWPVIEDNIWGNLQYNPAGETFNYYFYAQGIAVGEYALIYYADPWPGNNPGAVIDIGTTLPGTDPLTGDAINYLVLKGQKELNMSLPHEEDENYPDGAKIWLIPTSALDGGTDLPVVFWTPNNNWLFETELITYHDTDLGPYQSMPAPTYEGDIGHGE